MQHVLFYIYLMFCVHLSLQVVKVRTCATDLTKNVVSYIVFAVTHCSQASDFKSKYFFISFPHNK